MGLPALPTLDVRTSGHSWGQDLDWGFFSWHCCLFPAAAQQFCWLPTHEIWSRVRAAALYHTAFWRRRSLAACSIVAARRSQRTLAGNALLLIWLHLYLSGGGIDYSLLFLFVQLPSTPFCCALRGCCRSV